MESSNWTEITKKLILFALSIIVIIIGFRIGYFYIPFVIAFALSQLLEPLIKFGMKRFKLKRKVSAIIIFTIIISTIIGLTSWGIVTLITEATNFLSNFNIYYDKVSAFSQNLISNFNFDKIQVSTDVSNVINDASIQVISTSSGWVKGFVSKVLETITSLPSIILYIVITILALYFMCTDKIYMLDQLEHHLPQKWAKNLSKHVKQLTKSLGCYLKAQVILISISFVISLIGLVFFSVIGMNIKYPLMAAIGIALIDALPILGSGTAMIPWAIISACNGDLTLGISIFALWIVMTLVRQFAEPKIVSKQIGIHPIFTLIAMYTGFKVIGFAGLFVGPIILIILKNIYEVRIDRGFVRSIFEKWNFK